MSLVTKRRTLSNLDSVTCSSSRFISAPSSSDSASFAVHVLCRDLSFRFRNLKSTECVWWPRFWPFLRRTRRDLNFRPISVGPDLYTRRSVTSWSGSPIPWDCSEECIENYSTVSLRNYLKSFGIHSSRTVPHYPQ
jgi:hypothetical protein